MGMERPLYHYPARATIKLALIWHSVAEEIADLKLKIAKPWGSKDFFTCVDYHTHNLEGYVPSPESLVTPSKPPPTELVPNRWNQTAVFGSKSIH